MLTKTTFEEAIKFSITGILSVIINFGFYYFLFNLSGYILMSASLGYIAGLANSFFLGRYWVFKFKKEFSLNEIYLFGLVYLVGGVIMMIIIGALDSKNFNYVFSWFCGAAYAVINNFIGSKFVVFKK